jgi:hypothetical protein
MANTLTNLTNTIISRTALEAFVAALTPVRAFCTNISADAAERGDKIKVMNTAAATAAAAFAGTYAMQDSTAEGLDVALDQHYFVSWYLTDKQIAEQPQLRIEQFGRQKGFQLAKKVLQDVLSLVTAANYGAAAFTGAASGFDADDVADLETTCDEADWPEIGRSLILKPTYHGSVVKDNAVQGTLGVDQSPVLSESRVRRLHNFDLYKSSLIPANGENLVGLAVHPDAMLFASRYLAPQEGADYADARALTDAETGITIGFRKWYDKDSGQMRNVLETLWGKLKGNGSACKRLVSA